MFHLNETSVLFFKTLILHDVDNVGKENIVLHIFIRLTLKKALCKMSNKSNAWCESALYFDEIVTRNLLSSTNSSDVFNKLGTIFEDDVDGVYSMWGYDIFSGGVVLRDNDDDNDDDYGEDEVFVGLAVDEDVGVVEYEDGDDYDYDNDDTKRYANDVELIGRFRSDILGGRLRVEDSRITWPTGNNMVRLLSY